MQSTREHTNEPQTAAAPERPAGGWLTVYEVGLTLPVLAVSIIGLVRYPNDLTSDLLAWMLLIAAIDLLPVSPWRGVEMLLDFPMLMAVAILYRPETACLALFVASFDMRELRGKIDPLLALMNRSIIAASALAASVTFHSLADKHDQFAQLAAAGTLAIVAAYVVNAGLAAVGVSLKQRWSLADTFRRLHIGRPLDFLVNYLGLGVIGIAAAKIDLQVGFWGVLFVILPLALARQSFFRSLALEEAQEHLSAAYAAERGRVEELERLDRAKAEVAQVLTHDFLHAIATLRTYVTALRRKWDRMNESERIEVTGWIEREADRLKALAEQSVAVMFGDADGPALALESERVGDLVEEAVDATNHAGGRLELDVPSEAGAATVRADRVRVLQVFRNLLGNAAAYSEPGTPIELHVRVDNGEVRFAVRDHGAGIDPGQTEQLFRPFSRLPGPATEAVQGSGLGLYISRQIVEAHAGRIGVESEPGEGSEFWFTLRRTAS
ncbi:MAG TPA: HAMP domain-containing sensor histidine kinase [Actinomycetota bacterium]|nr:HAMP domain-containing sensor histidine kinase [Actinomycetota bacterium]